MSKIQWTDVSDNPIYIRREDGSNGGHWCSKKSEGCASCYAEEINQSGFFSFASHLSYTGKPPEGLYFDESIVNKWAKMRTPKKHFVCSMTDLFGEWVPREWQFKVFDAALAAPSQTIQLLTKRPEIAVKAAREWCVERDRLYLPENCWMGVSVENQVWADRRKKPWQEMALLVRPKTGVTWVSYEPALSRVDWSGWEAIKLLVIGGESGNDAREFHLDWGRSAIEWCEEWNVLPFLKQIGSHALGGFESISEPPGCQPEKIWIPVPYKTSDRKGGDINELPEDLRVRKLPEIRSNSSQAFSK